MEGMQQREGGVKCKKKGNLCGKEAHPVQRIPRTATSKPSKLIPRTPLSRAAEGDSSDGDPTTIMPNFIVGTNGMIILLSHCCAHSHQPSSDMTLSIVTFVGEIMQTTSMGSETA